MLAALREIRREGWKIAAVYALVDAALLTLAVNLALRVSPPPGLPASLPLPAVVAGTLSGGAGPPPTVETSAVGGALVGILTLAIEFGLRIRRPLVEQFEAANPDVREALRTARDVAETRSVSSPRRNSKSSRDLAEDGRETIMAVALYEDVLERLRRTSSAGLLDLRRVAATVLLVTLVSLATVHVAVVDLEITGLGSGPSAGAGDVESTPASEYEGLNDGSGILGDAENVSAGDEELEAELPGRGGGDGNGAADASAAYDSGGFSGEASVEGQGAAAFGDDERVEDAELIREYNLKIRSTDGNAST